MKLNDFKNENLLLLAEDIGFHVGDGNICIRRVQTGSETVRHDFTYSGNKNKDYDYFYKVLTPRKRKLFNINRYPTLKKKKSEIRFTFTSKRCYELFKNMGIKAGNKNNILIPSWIMKGSISVKVAFLRGFMDSDGSLAIKKRHKSAPYYPVITFTTKSENLFEGLKTILNDLNFKYTSQKRNKHDLRTKKTYSGFQIDI